MRRWRLCRASIEGYDAPVHEWKGETVSSGVLDKLVELITAAFGLVAALAWNTAIQELFTAVLPEAADLVTKFLYAVVVTVIVVFVTIRSVGLRSRRRSGSAGCQVALESSRTSPSHLTLPSRYDVWLADPRPAGRRSLARSGWHYSSYAGGTTPSFTFQMQRIAELLRHAG